MIEKFIENLVVLDGEVAVPCNLQSAIAGFNAIERLIPRWVYQARGVDVSSPLQWNCTKSRQAWKGAALGVLFHVPMDH